MSHSLAFLLVPPDKTYTSNIQTDDFDLFGVLEAHSGANSEGEYERFALDVEGGPPMPEEEELLRWKMTARQVRLELLGAYPDQADVKPGPDTSLEELADIRNQRRQFAGERYWVEDGYVCAESPANPYPKYDYFEEEGPWVDDSVEAPPPERKKVMKPCSVCQGRGTLPGNTYMLPRFLRLSAAARADDGKPKVCHNCDGAKEIEGFELVYNEPVEQEQATIPEILAAIENSESGRPSALIDEKGVWHGPEGGFEYGVPEEQTEQETLENAILKPLREAPEGTTVLVLDIHM